MLIKNPKVISSSLKNNFKQDMSLLIIHRLKSDPPWITIWQVTCYSEDLQF